MRKLVIAITAIMSASAYACPNLSGTYTRCEPYEMEKQEQVVITQTRSNGVLVYSINYQGEEPMSMQLIADGRTRSETFEQDGIEVTRAETSTCRNNILHYNNVTTVLGTAMAFDMKFYRQNDGGLVTEVITPDSVEKAVCY